MGDDRVVSFGADDEMDMRRAIRVSAERTQKLPNRAVIRDRIEPGLRGSVPVFAGLICREDAAKVPVRLNALLLDVIETVVVGLPNVDQRPGNWLPIRVEDPARYDERFAFSIKADVCAGIVARSFGDIERPENCVLGGSARTAVVDRVDQH
ncbi:hypothetical protein D9M70_458670 [compost metagenome]